MSEIVVSIFGALMAFIAALIGTFAGGGYSLMFFPLLLHFVPGEYAEHLAVSKLGGLAITILAGQMHFKRTKLDPNLLFMLTIFGFLGTGIGTYLIQYHLNELLYQTMLGFALLIGAAYLFIQSEVGQERHGRRKITKRILLEVALFATGVGILNGLFGGTGIFTTLYLVFVFRFTFRQAIAYTMLSYLLVNVAQVGYLMSTESVNLTFAFILAVAAGAGGWVGTHLQYLKGNAWIKSAVIALMLILGVTNVVMVLMS